MIESPWIAYAQPNETAAFRLFCLPHAGGGANSYREWVTGLAPEIEVLPVQLPGREMRFLERPFDNMTPLLEALHLALRPLLNKPFALFGHSLGALIGFELARRLENEGFIPQHLFVSGYGAPQLPVKLPPMHHLDDEQFVAALQDLGTVPTAVLQNEELLALLLPMLRADFAVYERYQYQDAPLLTCPLTILGGQDDLLVPPEMLQPWAQHSVQPGDVHLFPGGHFYLSGQKTAVWQLIQQKCFVQQTT